jgi:hypothetical protein
VGRAFYCEKIHGGNNNDDHTQYYPGLLNQENSASVFQSQSMSKTFGGLWPRTVILWSLVVMSRIDFLNRAISIRSMFNVFQEMLVDSGMIRSEQK